MKRIAGALPAVVGVLLCTPLLLPSLERVSGARWILPAGLPGELVREDLLSTLGYRQAGTGCDIDPAAGELGGMAALPMGVVRRFAAPAPAGHGVEVELAGLPAEVAQLRIAALDPAGDELWVQELAIGDHADAGFLRVYLPPGRMPEQAIALAVSLGPAGSGDHLAAVSGGSLCGPGVPRVRLSGLTYAGAGAGWLLVAAYLVVPGAFLGVPRRLRDVRLVHLFTVTWSSFLVQGLIGWALVALGRFDPVVDSLALLASCLGALAVRLRRGRPWEPIAGSPLHSLWVVAALLVLAWFVRAPSEIVLGASDSGTYKSIASDLALTGQVTFDRGDLQSLPEAERAQLYLAGRMSYSPQRGATYPGYYLMPDGRETTRLFFYPAMLARIVAAVGPVDAVLWNGYCALLALLSFAVLLESLWGIAVALPAALVLGVSFAHVSTSLECFTEPSAQVMLFGGLACWIHWDRTGSRASALLGGLALGGSMALRIDSFVLYPPLALLLGLRLTGRKPGLDDAIAWTALVGSAALSLYVSWTLSPAYTADVLHASIFSHAPWLERSGTWLALASFLAAIVALRLMGGWNGPTWRNRVPILATAALGAAALWASSIPPPAYNLQQDAANFVRLGWYTTGLGLWLGVAGLCGIVAEIRDRRQLTVVACLLATTLLYLQGSRITQVHPYWGRRFVLTAVPLAALGAGWLLARLAASRRLRLPAVVLGLGLLGGSLSLLAQLRGRPYYQGLHAQVQAVAERIPPGARLLVLRDQRTEQLVVPLRHTFGVDAYLWTGKGDLRYVLERWQRAGRRTYLLRSATASPPADVAISSNEGLLLQFDEIGVDWRIQATAANPLKHIFVNDEAVSLRLGELALPLPP